MGISQKSQKRHAAFMEAGSELFLENGYEGTSLNDIVRKSGGSLSSIYKFFNNKQGLFTAILDKQFQEFVSELDSRLSPEDTVDIRSFLLGFATIYIKILHNTEAISFSRIIISENYKNKEIGKIFFERVTNKTTKILLDFFDRKEVQERLETFNHPCFKTNELLAYKFCAMIREPFYTHALVSGDIIDCISKHKNKEEIASVIVDLFLNGALKK